MDRRIGTAGRSSRRSATVAFTAFLLTSVLATSASADAGFAGAGTLVNFFGTRGTLQGPIVGELQGEAIGAVLECEIFITSGGIPSVSQPVAPFDGGGSCDRLGRGVGQAGPWDVDFSGTLTGTVIQLAGTLEHPGGAIDPFTCIGQITPTDPGLATAAVTIACSVGPLATSVVVAP